MPRIIDPQDWDRPLSSGLFVALTWRSSPARMPRTAGLPRTIRRAWRSSIRYCRARV